MNAWFVIEEQLQVTQKSSSVKRMLEKWSSISDSFQLVETKTQLPSLQTIFSLWSKLMDKKERHNLIMDM